MTTIKQHLTTVELEHRYETASEAIAKSHFHALWLLSRGYDIDQVANLLSFSTRWVRILIKRYNEGGPDRLGDQRVNNGTEPTILTPEAMGALKERLKSPPDDGGQWTGPKIARWLARYHGLKSVHDQRGWDALMAIGWSIQQPRPRHPEAAADAERAHLKKTAAGGRRREAPAS
jgi:transposase